MKLARNGTHHYHYNQLLVLVLFVCYVGQYLACYTYYYMKFLIGYEKNYDTKFLRL